MSAPFATNYIENRYQLNAVAESVIQYAEDISLSNDEQLEKQIDTTNSQIRILVLGEKGVGKTSVFEKLLIRELKHKRAKAEHSVQVHDFSADQTDLSLFDVVEVSHLAGYKRKDIEVLTHDADVILWIISSENPWCATTWTHISNLTDDVFSRSAVVLSKVDLLDQGQEQVMLSHLQDLNQNRAGGKIETIHTVSSLGDGLLLVDILRDWINNKIEHSRKRIEGLNDLISLLHVMHEDSEYVLNERKKALDGEQDFLSSLEADIDRQRVRQIELYGGVGVNLARAFEDEIESALDYLHGASSVSQSIVDAFGRGLTPLQCERYAADRASTSFAKKMESDCLHILSECRDHWKKIRSHLEQRLGFGSCEFDDEQFKSIIPNVMESINKSSRYAILGMKMRILLESYWVPRRKRLKMLILSILSGVTVAGVLGGGQWMFPPWGALAFLAVSGVLFILLAVHCLKTRRDIICYLSDFLVDKRMQFIEAIRDDYQAGITELFYGYAPMFKDLRSKIAQANQTLVPLEEEWKKISLALRTTQYSISQLR